MSKKDVNDTPTEYDFPPEPGEEEGGVGDLDFNVTDEYKPDPLIPQGTYHAVATGIKFLPAKFCIAWDFCLHDNGGVMSDGETPIDNAHITFNNWLPKSGDEAIMTKSGKSTKRQSKINMLMDFQNEMVIDMSTPSVIAESLTDQVWIGLEADLELGVGEWQGRFRNEVNRVKKSTM